MVQKVASPERAIGINDLDQFTPVARALTHRTQMTCEAQNRSKCGSETVVPHRQLFGLSEPRLATTAPASRVCFHA
jgi:hypothetical protein